MSKDKKSYRILVIEDNPADLVLVEEFLSEQIFDPVIVHAGSFKQASTILSTVDILFDVILLDLSLADKSGQDLITEMLRVASLCPVIILTGYADIDFSIKSISQGILDYLLKDDLNSVTLYKSIIYAIERKKSISDLQESEKRYSDLFHLSPQPMWVFDPQTFRFVQVNKATIELYGFSEEEFMSMTIKDIIYNEDIRLTERAKAMQVEEVHYSQKNYRHRKKNGEIIQVELQENVIFFKGKKANIVVAFDITEKTKYIITIEDQNKKLREIAWMQSHVVRAPLARMMLLIDVIKGNPPDDGDNTDLLNNVLISATELDNVIRDISSKIAN